MGELAQDFSALKEYKLDIRNKQEPERIEYAKKQLLNIGYETEYDAGNKCLIFEYNNNPIKIYPFTGWFTGKGTGNGRGIHNLIKVLSNNIHIK